MNCTEFERHLDAYIDKTVSTAHARAMDEHRRTCSKCEQLAQAYKTAMTALNRTEKVDPPRSLTDSIFAHIAASDASQPGIVSEKPAVSCETFEMHAAAFVDGTLDGLFHTAMDTHRLTCRSCARVVRAHENLLDIFERTEQVTAPEGLANRIISTVMEEEALAARETGFFWKLIIPAAACIAAFAGYLAYVLPWRTALTYMQAKSLSTHFLPEVTGGAQDWMSLQASRAAVQLTGLYQSSDLAAWIASAAPRMETVLTTALNFMAEPLTVSYVSTGIPVYVIAIITMGLLVAVSYLTGGMSAVSYVQR